MQGEYRHLSESFLNICIQIKLKCFTAVKNRVYRIPLYKKVCLDVFAFYTDMEWEWLSEIVR